MTYYSIGQADIQWEGPDFRQSQQFITEIQSASDLLDSGNFAASQGPLRKALQFYGNMSSPSQRVEAEQILSRVINPKLKNFGFRLKISSLNRTITVEKITEIQSLFGSIPLLLLSAVVGTTFLGAGYMFYNQILRK